MDVITIISVIVSTLGVGEIISGYINRRLIKAEKEREEAEKARTQETVLLLTGIKAAGALSYATALAMKRGHANGEVEKGVEKYEEFNRELENFLIKRSAHI